MRILLWLAAFLVFGAGMSRADSMEGRWSVRSFRTRTATLDGKTFKGPFEIQPKGMTLDVTATTYVSTSDGKKTSYRIQPSGAGYVLTRTGEGGAVRITLSAVRRTASQLTFTSTSRNTRRREMTVVQWVCVPATAAASGLTGARWELVEIAYNDDKVLRPAAGEAMDIVFGADGKATGSAGKNRFNGSYTASKEGGLQVGPLASTRVANPPGSIADTFLKELQSARRYQMAGDALVLQLPYDTGIVRLRRAAP